MRSVVLVTLLVALSGGATAAWAQEATMNADVVRKAILEVPIWHIDSSDGTSLWHFEKRGDKLWAKVGTFNGKSMRDVQVEVTPDGLKWISPDGQQVTIKYDPQDIQFPFKGADSQGTIYDFTPK